MINDIDEIEKQEPVSRAPSVYFIIGIVLLVIGTVFNLLALALEISVSSGGGQDILGHQSRVVAIHVIALLLVLPFIKKKPGFSAISIIFIFSYLNSFYSYFVATENMVQGYLGMIFLLNSLLAIGLVLLWFANALYTKTGFSRVKIAILAIIAISLLSALVAPRLRPQYNENIKTGFDKKVADSLKDIWVPAGINLAASKIEYATSNNNGGYKIATNVKECPVLDKDWLTKNGWNFNSEDNKLRISVTSSKVEGGQD